MGAVRVDCGALVAEIEAFEAGFGQPRALTDSLHSAVLLVAVTADTRLLTSAYGGLDWICAFTSEREYGRYLAARGEFESLQFHALASCRIIDDLASTLERPTGVVVDIAGASPMAFPPAEVWS